MSEILDVLGPHLQHLTELSEDMNYSVMRGEMAPGVFVPLHSHDDRETFTMISGELEVWKGNGWEVVRAGDSVDIPGYVKHAWRNVSSEKAVILMVSTVKMGKFFKEVGHPAVSVPPGPPTPEALQNFFQVVKSYGYWLGTPADNAEIGLMMG